MKETLETIDLLIKIVRESLISLVLVIGAVWLFSNYDFKLSQINVLGTTAQLIEKANNADNKSGSVDSMALGLQSEAAFAITTEEPGWVYVGTYKNNAFSGETYFTVNELPKVNEFINSKMDINKRTSPPYKNESGDWWKGKVIGLVTANQRVKVLEVDQTIPVKGGGIRVWVKVEPIKNI